MALDMEKYGPAFRAQVAADRARPNKYEGHEDKMIIWPGDDDEMTQEELNNLKPPPPYSPQE